MTDENKTIHPEEQEPKKPQAPEQEDAVLYDASELSDDDLEGLSSEEAEDASGAGVFFVPVFIAANINVVANINAGANLNVAANAMAAANAVAAANVNAAANANALTNVNVTE